MRTAELIGVGGNLMRNPRTKDDYWYQRVKDAEPKRIYRTCPKCGMKTGIPEIYPSRFCYMCNTTVYVDEELNERERKKYQFLKELKKKGITNDNKKKKDKKER